VALFISQLRSLLNQLEGTTPAECARDKRVKVPVRPAANAADVLLFQTRAAAT